MSTIRDITPHPAGGQPSGPGFDMTPADRVRGFEKARRHSRHVRVLRIALPIATVAMIGVYVFGVLKTAGVGKDIVAIALPKILATDLAMQNPHYEGYSEDGSMYKVRANSAKPDMKNTNLINLVGITADLVDTQKKKTTLTAKSGLYDSKKSLLILRDDIRIEGEDGLKATLQRADVYTKSKVIRSNKPVDVQFSAGSVRSDKMLFQQKLKHVRFNQNVKAVLKSPARKPSEKTAASSANQMFVGSDKPVTITSQALNIYDGDKRAVFQGNVTAQQGLARLTTPALEASYDAGKATTTPKSAAEPQSISLISGGQGKLRRIVAKGPVVMTQGPRDRVTCNAADFDAVNETAVLTGDVVMTSGPGRSARSDRVDLDQLRERAVLTGNVVVSQDKNVLKGRRLEVDQRNAITKLTSPAGVGSGPGRISAHFIQAPNQRKRSAKKGRQTGPFHADPNAPLDIMARELVVRDKVKTAVFTGSVKARQGAFRIETAELQALYKGSAALGSVSSRGNATPDGATSLTHIKARRDVIITGNNGQTVKGDWADFDVAAGKATVGGQVEIKQGGNVIHGTRLTIDTNSGRTVIETAPQDTVAQPQGGGWVTSNRGGSRQTATPSNGGRPSAIFYLNDIDKARRQQKQGPNPSTGSSWQARTAP